MAAFNSQRTRFQCFSEKRVSKNGGNLSKSKSLAKSTYPNLPHLAQPTQKKTPGGSYHNCRPELYYLSLPNIYCSVIQAVPPAAGDAVNRKKDDHRLAPHRPWIWDPNTTNDVRHPHAARITDARVTPGGHPTPRATSFFDHTRKNGDERRLMARREVTRNNGAGDVTQKKIGC